MKELGILFSDPMVRAILDGRKTQTRRVVNPQPMPDRYIPALWEWNHLGSARNKPHYTEANFNWNPITKAFADWVDGGRCRYGKPGDRLWVREAWCAKMRDGEFVYDSTGKQECYYRATEKEHVVKDDGDGGTAFTRTGLEASPWVLSIHMPRWASRITLEVVSIHVERLNIITSDDALAEGIDRADLSMTCVTPQMIYRRLWESINGPGSWDKNPWVWVIKFKRA
jgi:hypothetical protein